MKTKDVFKSIAKYLRELSIVVVGIAITFGISSWVGNRNEQKNLQRYLGLVKMELEENLSIVQDQFEFYNQADKLATYLQSDKPERLQLDSIAKYDDVIKFIKPMVYKKSSFEMLKSTGAMGLIEDKGLLMSIIESYSFMESLKDLTDSDIKQKGDIFNSLMDYGNINDIRDPKFHRLFNFLSNNSLIDRNFRKCADQIEKTLVQF